MNIRTRLFVTFLLGIFTLAVLCKYASPISAEFCVDGNIKWKYEVLEDGISVRILRGSEPADVSAGNIAGSVTVPKILHTGDKDYTVTEIGDGAFNDRYAYSGITSITLPDSITSIGSQAFYNNTNNLTSVTISGNNLKSIGASAFYGCKNLNSISLPNSLISIGNYAFYNCSNLGSVVIPDNVETFGNAVFRGCTNLSTAVIGGKVPLLDGTFVGCSNLESVTIPNSVTGIVNYAFYGCGNLTSISIPCNFDKNKFSPSSASYINIPETDLDDNPDNDSHTFTVQGTSASGTFTYIHEYGDPTYTWEYDDTEHEWKCTAKITCSGCGNEIAENGVVTGEITRPATCSEIGETTYMATFTNPIFLPQTKQVEDVSIDSDAHNWITEWEHDENKHWHQCSLCEAISDETDHSWIMDSVITEATDTTPGEMKYLCSVCGQEKVEVILPHRNTDDTKNIHKLTNLDTPEDIIKNIVDLGVEKLKDLVDNKSLEESEPLNPDTGDHSYVLVFLTFGFSSLAAFFKLLQK